MFSEKNQCTATLCEALESLDGWLPKGGQNKWEKMVKSPSDLETWRATRGSLETLYVVDPLEKECYILYILLYNDTHHTSTPRRPSSDRHE